MKERFLRFFRSFRQLHSAEIYLIIVLLIFGIITCILLPVSGGYDEEHHLMRVWEMSSLTMLPNDKLGTDKPFPGIYWELSYRRKLIVKTVEAGFWDQYGSLPLDSFDDIYSTKTRSVYSPPLLLPQALVMRYLGLSLKLPALVVFYACRLSGLMSYILLAWLAVRFIPYRKWLLAIIASSPVAILQASTISADTISNGIALLFIGGVLSIAQREKLTLKDMVNLVFLLLILFWGKVNITPLALLPFLLFKRHQFNNQLSRIIIILIAIGLFSLEVFGWNLLAYSRYHDALPGADPYGQIEFILANLGEFIIILLENIFKNFINYLNAGTAIYPFNYWPVPIWTYYFYFAGLVIALVNFESNKEINTRTRVGLIIVFVIAYLGTIISLYLTYTPVGNHGIRGVQGRYFIAIMPLLFLALSNLSLFKRVQLPKVIPVILVSLSLVMYSVGMYLIYYIPCGIQYYRPGLCYQPGYKNWDPNARFLNPISEERSITQEILSECTGLTDVRIWMDASEADPNAKTEFTISKVDQSQIVVNQIVQNSNLPKKGWYTLSFPPDWDSYGKRYLLDIFASSNGGVGPKIAYNLQSGYSEGTLYENNKAKITDVIFQIGCKARWTE